MGLLLSEELQELDSETFEVLDIAELSVDEMAASASCCSGGGTSSTTSCSCSCVSTSSCA